MSGSSNEPELQLRQYGKNVFVRLFFVTIAVCIVAGAVQWRMYSLQTDEEIRWNEFERAMSKEPVFRELRVKYFMGVHWVTGSLQSETELERLLALADKCGIRERRLDGPYVHSISITIPGTARANEYH